MLNDVFSQWVAFVTKPRAEKKIYERLRNKGYTVYVPLQRQLRKSGNTKVWRDMVLIPSYVFAKIQKKDLFHIHAEEGVAYVVKCGEEPSIIHEEEINTLKLLADSKEKLWIHNMESLKKGCRVRVLAGLFEGQEGYLISDCKEGNFAVKIDSIRYMISLNIDKELLEVIE